MLQRNVLRVNAVEEQAAYRDAVAEILRNVQADYSTTLLEISETIDVSLGTVSNAANKKSDLNSIYLSRIGTAYGPHYLDPFARMMGGRLVSVHPDGNADVLPFLTMATHRVAQARSPTSPAGPVETLQEQLEYLPDLRHLQRELEAQIHRVEQRRDAA
jgi:hypothetical protein